MTDEAIRATSVRPWALKAGSVVDARMADARAHAWNALTHRVASARDDRHGRRAAMATRGHRAAVDRLDEITDTLAGPTAASRLGVIRDARAAFYRDSFPLWEPNIPEVLKAPDPRPNKSGERQARGLVVHGYDLRSEVADVVNGAKRAMAAAVTLAGRASVDDRQASDILDGWESQRREAIRRRVNMLIADSEVAIYNLVGRSMIDSRFHAEP